MIYWWFLPLIICVYGLIKQRFLLSPTALFFMYFAVILPLSYLVSYWLDIPSFFFNSPRSIGADELDFAFLQVMLSLLAFLVGRYLMPSPKLAWVDVSLKESRFKPLLLVSVVLALLGGVIVLHAVGGPTALIDDMGELRSGGLRGLGAGTYAVTNVLPTVAQFALMYAFRNHAKHLKIVLILCVISCLIAGVLGFRTGIFILLLQVASICYLMTGKPYRKQAMIAVPVFGLLISVMGYARILATDPQMSSLFSSADMDALLPLMADTGLTRTRGVETLVIMNNYMATSNFHYFKENAIETLHAFIPTFILSKDISTSEKIGTNIYSGYLITAGIRHDVYGGVSYTLIAESYWDLGLSGIVLTGLIIGWLFQIVERLPEFEKISYLQVIFYKTATASVIPLLESPQLAINSAIIGLMLNGAILLFLSLRLRRTTMG